MTRHSLEVDVQIAKLKGRIRDLEARNAELEAIEETRHNLRCQLVLTEAKVLMSQDKQDAAEARVKVLEEALRFYADEDNYKLRVYPMKAPTQYPVLVNGGAIARQALAPSGSERGDGGEG